MKKWICIMALLCYCVVCMQPVRADIIWEPEDGFYSKHIDECVYVNRLYTANGPDNIVIIYKNPESPSVVSRLTNGERMNISYVYTDQDGIEWGYADETGWTPMAYLEVVYDAISFEEAYADEIKAQSGSLDAAYMEKEILLWQYPGSENFYAVSPGENGTNLPEYSAVFTDEQGRDWGNTAYYYGYKDVWICLDEPDAPFEKLYPDNAPERRRPNAEDAVLESGAGRIAPKWNSGVIVFVCAAVGILVFVTAILLIKWKKREEK